MKNSPVPDIDLLPIFIKSSNYFLGFLQLTFQMFELQA